MSLLPTTFRRAARRAFGVGVITSTSSMTKLRFSSSCTKNNIEDDHLRNPQDHRLCNEAYQGILQIAETPNDKGLGLFASRNFETGDRIMTARGTRSTTVRDSHTVQRDWDSHVLMDLPAVLINHSCSANVGIRNSNSSVSNNNTISSSNNNTPPVFDFWAIRSISKGEELTWDYEASEWELSTPFECGCGSRDCRGKLKGFKHTGDKIRKRYGEYIADYLKDVDENN